MKKTFFLILMALMLTPLSSFAFQAQGGQTLNINAPINDDYYAAAGTVNINTSVAGDLSVAGGKIFITSAVGQDLMLIGGDTIINGSIGESARIAGGTVNINSAIQKDLFIGGGEVTLGANAKVKGDTIIGAGTLFMNGTINNANLNAEKMTIQGTIKGNAIIRAQKIEIITGARIIGNLTYRAEQKDAALENITSGKIAFTQTHIKKGMQGFGKMIGGYFAFGFFFLAIFGILFFYIGRNRFIKPIKQVQEYMRPCLGYGFLVYAVAPFAILLLMISVIGIPFGLALLAAYLCLFGFYKLFNVVFYSHLLIDRMGGMNKVKTWKKIGIILGFALISSIIAGISIIFSFFALGAVIKTCCMKSKK